MRVVYYLQSQNQTHRTGNNLDMGIIVHILSSRQNNMTKNKKIVIILLMLVLFIAIVPLFALKGAEFGGSDDAGSQMITEIRGEEYKPWFTPIMEVLIQGEIPGEVESLIFCIQTGIGVGIIAFFMGKFVERKKWEDKQNTSQSPHA